MGDYSNLKIIGGRLRATGVFLGGLTAAQVAALPLPLVPGTSWYNITTDTYDVVNSGGAISPVASGGFTEGSVLFADAGGDISQDNANFFWDDTNNSLGIGTAIPKLNLHIVTSGTSGLGLVPADRGLGITGIGGQSRLYFEATDNTVGKRVFVIDNDADVLSFSSLNDAAGAATNSNILVIGHDGNVGIGTASPQSDTIVHVSNGDTTKRAFLKIQNTVSGTNNEAILQIITSDGLGLNLRAFGEGNSRAGEIHWDAFNNPNGFIIETDGSMKFRTGGSTQRMVIDDVGNVGIGTTIPSAKLVVNGGLHVGGNSDPGDNNLLVDGNTEIVGQLRAAVGSATTPSHAFNLDLDSGMYSIGANILGFATGGAERIRIASSGNVGIGTPAPNALLDVSRSSAGEVARVSVTGNSIGSFGFYKSGGTTKVGMVQFDGQGDNSLDILCTGGGTNPLILGTSAVERMRISGGGSVGIGTLANPLASTVLQVDSTSQGLMPPRWTDAQETTNTGGFGAGDAGVMWYNTTVNSFKGWNGSAVVLLG